MNTSTQLDLNGIRKAKNIARLFIITACVCSVYLATLPFQAKPLPVTALPTTDLNFVQFEEPAPPPPVRVEPVKRLLAEESDIKVETPPEQKEPEVVPLKPPVVKPAELPPPIAPVKEVKEKVVPKEPRKKEVKPVAKPVPVKNSKLSEAKPSSNESIKPASLAESTSELQAKNKLASLLLALIEKKKKYPKAAIRSATEGTCHAKFRFDKEGRIISATLSVPSGKGVLDRASNQLAQQLIGTNFNIPNSGIEIQVPIKFELVNG